jgi:hypothetical protein
MFCPCMHDTEAEHEEFLRLLGESLRRATERIRDLTCEVTPLEEIPAALGGTKSS